MKKKENKFFEAVDKLINFADEHQREILLGCTIVGVISTGITAWRNSPKAQQITAKHKETLAAIEDDLARNEITEEEAFEEKKEEYVDYIKGMTPLVLPPVILGTGTIVAAVGGHASSTKKLAAISAAYTATEKAYDEYKDKAEEFLGEKKSQELRDEVNKEVMEKAYATTNNGDIIETGYGNTLFYDKYCGRFFRSSWESIRKAINDINRRANDSCNDEEILYNEVASEYGLPDDTVFGDMMAFRRQKGHNVVQIHLITSTSKLESKMYPGTMESATVIDYANPPKASMECTKL